MQIGSLMDRTDRGNFDNSRIRIENTRSSWEMNGFWSRRRMGFLSRFGFFPSPQLPLRHSK